jgi:hypothetical protein
MENYNRFEATSNNFENGTTGGEAGAVPKRESTRAAGAVGCIKEDTLTPNRAATLRPAGAPRQEATGRKQVEYYSCLSSYSRHLTFSSRCREVPK